MTTPRNTPRPSTVYVLPTLLTLGGAILGGATLVISAASTVGTIAVLVAQHRAGLPPFEHFQLALAGALIMVLIGAVFTSVSLKLGRSYHTIEELERRLHNSRATISANSATIRDLKVQLQEATASNQPDPAQEPEEKP